MQVEKKEKEKTAIARSSSSLAETVSWKCCGKVAAAARSFNHQSREKDLQIYEVGV